MLRIICFHSRQADSADESKLHGREKVQNDLAWCHRAVGNSLTQTMKKKKKYWSLFSEIKVVRQYFWESAQGSNLEEDEKQGSRRRICYKTIWCKVRKMSVRKKEKFCPLCGFHFKEITRFKCNKQVSDILQTFTLHLVWVSEALHNYHTKKTTLDVHRTCTHV